MIWLPYPNFSLTCKVLRHEDLKYNADNILHALNVLHQTTEGKMEDWIYLWQGHELRLADFGLQCLDEMNYRSLPATDYVQLTLPMVEHFNAAASGSTTMPKLPGNWCLEMKARLLDVDLGYYGQFFGSVKPFSERS